jgi:hypothetical protein
MESTKNAVEALTSKLECPICLETFKRPVVIQCCGNGFCEDCLLQVKNKCPYCDKVSGYIVDYNLENYLRTMPIVCQCGDFYSRESQQLHLLVCKSVRKPCKFCDFIGNALERLQHGFVQHQNALEFHYLETVD